MFGILLIIFSICFINKKLLNINKKIAIITGATNGIGKELVKYINSNDYIIIIYGKNNADFSKIYKINEFINNIKEKYDKIDLLINCFYDSSNLNFDYQINVNLNNTINLINGILPIMKSEGKIINISCGLNTITNNELLNNYLFIKSSIDKYFKLKSLEYFDKKIALTTLKIDSTFNTELAKKLNLSNLSNDFSILKTPIEFIINNDWITMTGREFYTSNINEKKSGYYLELAYPYIDKITLNDEMKINVYNGENAIKPNIQEIELTTYSNSKDLLLKKLGEIHNIDTDFIHFQNGIFDFLEIMTPILVPNNHEIISSLMGYLNVIGKNRKVINIDGIIENNNTIPNYDLVIKNITSLTRMIYFIAPLNKNSFDEFLKKVPFNIPIIIDFCYNGFVNEPNQLKIGDYVSSEKTIICIDTFSKFYGLPGLHLSYTVCKKDIKQIINNHFHYPINAFYEKIALKILNDTQYLENVKKYYDNERYKLTKILIDKKIKYWFNTPNALFIERTINISNNKFNDTNNIYNFLMETKLEPYFKVIKYDLSTVIILYINKIENNDILINKIIEIFNN